MAKIIPFQPKCSDWDQNLADYVHAAKNLPFMAGSRIVWGAPSWDLTGLAKPERAGQDPKVKFGLDRLGRVCIHLSQSMAETRKTKPMKLVRVFSQRRAMRRKRSIR